MTTEGQRAPRVAPHRDSMAGRFAAAKEAGAPLDGQFPQDEALTVLDEASSILELLSAGFDDAGESGELHLRNGAIYSRAFDGISRLLRLARCHVDCLKGDVA